MKTNNHHRRLDRVQENLHTPDAGGGNPKIVYQFCNVPNLPAACERAKRVGVATVFFVPLSGSIQRADCGQADGSEGVGLAFEGPVSTPDQIARVKDHGGELAFARAGLCEGEGVGISCAGGPLFWVGVSPELMAAVQGVTGPNSA
jgi:hypothetical protein